MELILLDFSRIQNYYIQTGYAESDLRGFLENTVFPGLPAELKAAIKTVVNQQSAYSLAENKLFAQETQDRLWVPNVNELFNSNNHTYDGSSRLGAGMFTAINGFGTVRIIYAEFQAGLSFTQIAKELTDLGIKSPAGKDVWNSGTVKSILMKLRTTDFIRSIR